MSRIELGYWRMTSVVDWETTLNERIDSQLVMLPIQGHFSGSSNQYSTNEQVQYNYGAGVCSQSIFARSLASYLLLGAFCEYIVVARRLTAERLSAL